MKKTRPKKSSLLKEIRLGDEKDNFVDLGGVRGSSLLLGRYSVNEVLTVLEKKNFFREAEKRKLWPLCFDLDSSSFPLQRLQIFYRDKKPENIIVDLKIKEGAFIPIRKLAKEFSSSKYQFLIFEWLTLQNPLLSFSAEKTPLPGQKHPGLNLGKKVLDIFIYLARLTMKDGLMAYPAYFHNALLFARYFRFLDPRKEGEVLAVRKSFPRVSFKQLAWIVFLGCLREKRQGSYEWRAEEMVYPMNKELKNYFGSKAYKEKVKESERSLSFDIDWECFRVKSQTPI
jgi:hypothetical protein